MCASLCCLAHGHSATPGHLSHFSQAGLLRAACYGAAFCALDPKAAAAAEAGGGAVVAIGGKDARRAPADVARRLRLLNALREPGQEVVERGCCRNR